MKIVVKVPANVDIVRVESAIRTALMIYNLDIRSIQVIQTGFREENNAREHR